MVDETATDDKSGESALTESGFSRRFLPLKAAVAIASNPAAQDTGLGLVALGSVVLTAGAGYRIAEVAKDTDITSMYRVPPTPTAWVTRHDASASTRVPTDHPTLSPDLDKAATEAPLRGTVTPSSTPHDDGRPTKEEIAQLLHAVEEVKGKRVFKVYFEQNMMAYSAAYYKINEEHPNLGLFVIGDDQYFSIRATYIQDQTIHHLNRIFKEAGIDDIVFEPVTHFNDANLIINLANITFATRTETGQNPPSINPVATGIAVSNPENPLDDLRRVYSCIYNDPANFNKKTGSIYLNQGQYDIAGQYSAAMVDDYAFGFVVDDVTNAINHLFNVRSLKDFQELVRRTPYVHLSAGEQMMTRTAGSYGR